ncbi:MAG: hypothetical protein AAGB46_08240 [Verrucomicrobiota bacterium]
MQRVVAESNTELGDEAVALGEPEMGETMDGFQLVRLAMAAAFLKRLVDELRDREVDF